MKNFRFYCGSLLLLFVSGCFTPHHRDPLQGWSLLGSITWNGPKLPGESHPIVPEAIVEDYRNYIHNLPVRKGRFADRSESYFIDEVSFFQNALEQHAVTISICLDGTWSQILWRHVLVYDANNKRIKTMKYKTGRSIS